MSKREQVRVPHADDGQLNRLRIRFFFRDVPNGELILDGRAHLLAALLSRAKVAAIAAIMFFAAGAVRIVMVGTTTATILTLCDLRLLWSDPYDRPRRMKTMGLGEAVSYPLEVVALAPVLGVAATAAFTVLPILWFLFFNVGHWGQASEGAVPVRSKPKRT